MSVNYSSMNYQRKILHNYPTPATTPVPQMDKPLRNCSNNTNNIQNRKLNDISNCQVYGSLTNIQNNSINSSNTSSNNNSGLDSDLIKFEDKLFENILEDNLRDMESNLCKLMDNNQALAAAAAAVNDMNAQEAAFFKEYYYGMLPRAQSVNLRDKFDRNMLNQSNSSYLSPTCFQHDDSMLLRAHLGNSTHNLMNINSNHPMAANLTSTPARNNRNYYFNAKKSVKMTVPSNKRQILEEEFRKEKYPSNEKLQKLSSKLNMRYDEVQNYFKKRRKEEKETNHKFSNLVKLLNNYLEQED